MRKSIKPINILFRNDDPCALSNPAHERRYLEIFAKYGVPQVVSVIPFMCEDPHNANGTNFHPLTENPAIVELLREYADKGLVEIAQHGTTHQTNQLHPSNPIASIGTPYPGLGSSWLQYSPMYPEKGYSEFSGLDKNRVRSELKRGRDYLGGIFQDSIESFTFPWGTLDANTLTALKEEGYKAVLCGGRNFYFEKDLMTIYNGREDTFEFARELGNGKLNGPALYHIVLHSWMLKDHELVKLDGLLSRLAADKRVGFVTIRDLRQWPVKFQFVLAADFRSRVWSEAANHYLGAPIGFPRRYDLTLRNYWKALLKSGLVVLVFEKIGFYRLYIFSGLLFLISVLFLIGQPGRFSLLDLIFLAGAGSLSLILSYYKFKNKFLVLRYGANRQAQENYRSLSVKAFNAPLDRPASDVFFRLYEQKLDAPPEDREKYLQLKSIHSSKPVGVLNELAAGYAGRGLNAFAFMCYAESLRLDPRQTENFRRMEALKGIWRPKQPELKQDECAVSVIVCTNRSIPELKTCLQSILVQGFKDFEIILLNDGGPDTVRQVADLFRDPRIRYTRLDRNVGLPKARNVAVQLAKGKYIAYLDDDDVFYPDHLGTLYKATQMGNHRFVFERTRGIFGHLKDGEFCEEKELFNWGGEFDRERFAAWSSIGVHAVLHEKSLFRDLGLFNEELTVSEDEDFWLRCAAAIDLKHIPQNTSEYRMKSDNNVITNVLKNHFGGNIVRKFHAAFQGELARLKYLVTAGDKKEAQAVLDNIKTRYMRGYFKSGFVLRELIPLVKYCGDNNFLKNVLSDFHCLYKEECTKSFLN